MSEMDRMVVGWSVLLAVYLLVVRSVMRYNSSPEGQSQIDMERDCR